MLKYRLKYLKSNCILLSFIVLISCKYERNKSSIELIHKYKQFPKAKQSELFFSSDTLYFKVNEIVNGGVYIYGKNINSVPLNIAAVVASYNCKLVTYNKKNIEPGDSLRIHLMVTDSVSSLMSAITIIGNLPAGHKTIFIKSK